MINEASHIIRQIVESMNNTIIGEYDSITGNTDICDTKWSRKGKIVTDAFGNQFLISEIDYDVSITGVSLTDPLLTLDGTITIPAPYFISGTKLAANREWTIAGNDLTQKTPIIWLLETISETFYGRGDTRERDMELRLFFLDETNIKDYYTEDHRREVVYPMEKLAQEFIKTINQDRRFQTIERYRMRSFSRFGAERDNGVFQNILDANLSGLELNLNLVKYKENCKC